MEESLKVIDTAANIGLGGASLFILLKWVIPTLTKVVDRLSEMGTVITLLITSLPDIKQRAKDEAKRLHGKFQDEEK
jgi:hypothetical protein